MIYYNYNHPADIYVMAVRAADQPDVSLSHDEFDRLLIEQYEAGEIHAEPELMYRQLTVA